MQAAPKPEGVAFAPAGAAPAVADPRPGEVAITGAQAFTFTGSGAEYFRIWVVNLLLTVATLGVYSAWAKVRRLQYFYRNTRVAGAVFDYHGDPKAILKGRAVALALLLLYEGAAGFSFGAGVVVTAALLAFMPWLLSRSFRFKLANSSWCGLRFRFDGGVADAYRSLILLPVVAGLFALLIYSLYHTYSRNAGFGFYLLLALLSLAAAGSAVPYAHYLLKRYQHDHAYFGHAPFMFHARPRAFFVIYAKALGLFLLGIAVMMWSMSWLAPLVGRLAGLPFAWLGEFLAGLLILYLMFFFARPFLEARVQNLVWNKTELSDHRFESCVSARKLLWLHASNLALIIATAGLYKPFAAVRLARYRVACMSLAVTGALEEFTAEHGDDIGAAGQEAGEFFDIDIAL
jgi:uncharacterized membrane protein YjgN (DUF898 family)